MFGKVWMCTLMEGDERIEAVEEEESGARFNAGSPQPEDNECMCYHISNGALIT